MGWVFFRANSFSDAMHVLTHAFRFEEFRLADLYVLGLPRFEMALAFVTIGTVLAVDWVLQAPPVPVLAWWQRRAVRWACLGACFYGVVFFGVFEKVQFIYFQF